MYELEIQEIAAAIRSQKCVFFIGAGLSEEAGLPSWLGLIKSCLDDLSTKTDAEYLTIAQAYSQKFGRAALEAKVTALTDTSNISPTDLHQSLSELGVSTWLTTNYDDLLERALHCPEQNVVVEDRDLAREIPGAPIIIKIHGDYRRPHTIILTRNDYFLSHQQSALIWDQVRILLTKQTFVFLGYSLQDPDFSQLQAQLVHRLGLDGLRPSYAVMFDVDEVRKEDLLSRKVKVIELSSLANNPKSGAHRFVEMLSNILRQYPPLSPEYHGADEARKLVPDEVLKRHAGTGRLICCIEYRIFCSYLDTAQPMTFPTGWRAPVRREYLGDDYHPEQYQRNDQTNVWVGVAIFQIRSGTARRASAKSGPPSRRSRRPR